MGYGSRSLEALDAFYSGQLLNLNEQNSADQSESFEQASKVDAVSLSKLEHGLRSSLR